MLRYDRRSEAAQQKRTKWAYVYLVGNRFHHWYKIGVSQGLPARMAEMQVGCPVKLCKYASAWIEKPYELEKKLHGQYKNKRLRGEWFLLSDEDVEELQHLLVSLDCNKSHLSGV